MDFAALLLSSSTWSSHVIACSVFYNVKQVDGDPCSSHEVPIQHPCSSLETKLVMPLVCLAAISSPRYPKKSLICRVMVGHSNFLFHLLASFSVQPINFKLLSVLFCELPSGSVGFLFAS